MKSGAHPASSGSKCVAVAFWRTWHARERGARRAVSRARSRAVQRTRCLAPGDDLERSWLEAVEYLAEPCHPFLVAGEGTPTPDGRHVRPWAEADERLRVFQVAEKQRGSFESFAVAPIDPLAPTPDELVLASCPHAPGRVRVRLLHQPLPWRSHH